jgi:hypothetical protein
LGYGEERLGYFCGSDHCPVVLVLKSGGGDGNGKRSNSSAHADDETDYDTDDGEEFEDRKLPATKKAKVAKDVSAGKEVIDLT